MGLEKEILSRILTTKLDFALKWARKNSIWPMPMGISCCAIEMMAVAASRYDMARFGAEVLRFSPRQADCMIAAGTLVYKMAPVIKKIYEQMPEPKWVIAMGSCLCTGGMFHSYSTVQGLDEVIPVDVYVPGCPPRPENLLSALQHIQDLISSDEVPNKVRTAHEAQWELGTLFQDKLARVRALRYGRVVKSPGRSTEFPEIQDDDGRLVPIEKPVGIPVAGVRGGSVDLASDRYDLSSPDDEGPTARDDDEQEPEAQSKRSA
jgi:NADH-quinone oxidoreductase subunit B